MFVVSHVDYMIGYWLAQALKDIAVLRKKTVRGWQWTDRLRVVFGMRSHRSWRYHERIHGAVCGIGQTTHHDLSQEELRSPWALTLHFNLVL